MTTTQRINPKWWLLAGFLIALTAIYCTGCKNKPPQFTVEDIVPADTTTTIVTSVQPTTGLQLQPGETITIGDKKITGLGNNQAVVEEPVPVITREVPVLLPQKVKTKIVNRRSGNTDNSVTDKSKTVTKSDESVTDKSKEVFKTSDDDKIVTKTKEVRRGFPWWIVLAVLGVAAALWFLKDRLRIL